jgi:hypothetical protein
VQNIEEIVRNVERHGNDDQYSNAELGKYKKMLKDSKKPFYHGCVVQYTRLFAMYWKRATDRVMVVSRTYWHALRTSYPKAMQSLRPFMRKNI